MIQIAPLDYNEFKSIVSSLFGSARRTITLFRIVDNSFVVYACQENGSAGIVIQFGVNITPATFHSDFPEAIQIYGSINWV